MNRVLRLLKEKKAELEMELADDEEMQDRGSESVRETRKRNIKENCIFIGQINKAIRQLSNQ